MYMYMYVRLHTDAILISNLIIIDICGRKVRVKFNYYKHIYGHFPSNKTTL